MCSLDLKALKRAHFITCQKTQVNHLFLGKFPFILLKIKIKTKHSSQKGGGVVVEKNKKHMNNPTMNGYCCWCYCSYWSWIPAKGNGA